jgi:7,8-dihydropterin-6-yl-methyl-4-(beta-D-ribofuranosyl)aminobenzene 5'-phosphate synthase
MTVEHWVASCSAAFLLFIGYTANASVTDASIDPAKAEITVLYDAFGQTSAMKQDWGYAVLVEYGGKRILFDTGNNPDILAQNVKAKNIDLSKLDFVVMSHRHGDHMGGLAYVLKVNPKVTIYAPKEGFGVQAASIAKTHLSHWSSATTTVHRQRSCGLARPGLALIFNSSTRTRRSHLTSI